MRLYAVIAAVVATVVFAVPAQADEGRKVTCITVGDDSELELLGEEGDGCCIIKMNEDGEHKVIKLKGSGLLGLDDDLDAETRGKLIDENIRLVRATGQLKTDLAVKRLELEKLELAENPNPDLVAAKKKEINGLEAQLKDKRLDYEAAARKLLPDDMEELYLLGLGLGADDMLFDLSLGLPAGEGRRMIKCIKMKDDEED